jgi:hypothetical protein
MAGYVNFAALKQRVSIEQTATLLGLNAKPTGVPVVNSIVLAVPFANLLAGG